VSKFCDVPVEHVAALWPHVRPHIARCLDREGSGRFAPGDILQLLLESRARLWVSWDETEKTAEAAVVTEIFNYPAVKECRIWLIGGRNMRAWVKQGQAMIEAFALANGCHFVTGAMRKGWIRVGGEGWHQSGVMFEKRIR
jgi:hypothetical protein